MHTIEKTEQKQTVGVGGHGPQEVLDLRGDVLLNLFLGLLGQVALHRLRQPAPVLYQPGDHRGSCVDKFVVSVPVLKAGREEIARDRSVMVFYGKLCAICALCAARERFTYKMLWLLKCFFL